MNGLVEAYNHFQNNFGQGVELDYQQVVTSLFSKDFKKVANGVELVSKAEDLITQLQSVKEAAGAWSVDVKESIPSVCNTKLTLSYVLISEKLGKFGIIAIINSADQKKIDSIREVYYQF